MHEQTNYHIYCDSPIGRLSCYSCNNLQHCPRFRTVRNKPYKDRAAYITIILENCTWQENMHGKRKEKRTKKEQKTDQLCGSRSSHTYWLTRTGRHAGNIAIRACSVALYMARPRHRRIPREFWEICSITCLKKRI